MSTWSKCSLCHQDYDMAENYECPNCAMKAKAAEFKRIAKPLHEWLQRNFSPHHSIIIEHDKARVVSDEIGLPLKIALEHE